MYLGEEKYENREEFTGNVLENLAESSSNPEELQQLAVITQKLDDVLRLRLGSVPLVSVK